MEIKLPLITDSDNTYSTESITLWKSSNDTITIELGDRRVSVTKADLMKAISVL